jgi:hypothetical protein
MYSDSLERTKGSFAPFSSLFQRDTIQNGEINESDIYTKNDFKNSKWPKKNKKSSDKSTNDLR